MTDDQKKLQQALEVIDKLLAALNLAWGKFPTWKEQHDAWKTAKDAALKARTFKDNVPAMASADTQTPKENGHS